MKITNSVFTIPLLTLLLNSNVFAEQRELNNGWYGSLGLGIAHQQYSYNELNFGYTKWDFDNGANILLSSGIDLNNFSIEGEIAYRKMDIQRRILISGGGNIIDDYFGDQTQLSFLLNVFLQPSSELLISPYLGLGIGATKISWNNIHKNQTDDFIDDSDFVFTYQVIFGATYKFTKKIILKVDYRTIVSDAAELESSGGDLGRLGKQNLDVFLLTIKYRT